MGHTKGPWETYSVRTGSVWVRAVSGEHVTSLDSDNDAEIEANAALIAAAPDLLAACRTALRELQRFEDQPGNNTETLGTAALRAAIAKAEGQ
jgi:hypothetical protein